jgi:predicted SAM-dependent methyltransferase
MKKQIKINLGCGILLSGGFINVDKAFTLDDIKAKAGPFREAKIEEGATFVQADMCDLPFKDNYADYIETIDAIEHIPFRLVPLAFKEMYRVLKPKAKLALATVDFNELARLWMTEVANKPFNFEKYFDIMEVIYGNQIGGDAECHKTAFNTDYMQIQLVAAGFKKKNIKMIIYPTNCSNHPPFLSQKWPEGAVMRTTMIYVEATK